MKTPTPNPTFPRTTRCLTITDRLRDDVAGIMCRMGVQMLEAPVMLGGFVAELFFHAAFPLRVIVIGRETR